MKKQYTVIALLLTTAMVFTGCSWEDFTSKFVGGGDTASSGAVSGGPVEIEDYNAEDCVKLAEYKGVEVDCTVKNEEVQSQIDNLLNSYPNVKKIKKGTCEKGQTVNIDFVGKIDGKKFDNGSAEGYSMTLGASGFIDGFDDGVIGMKVGEKKDLNLKFPDDYQMDTSLAGKDVVFTVTVNYIEEASKAKFNDAFVKKNTDYKTVAEYKKETKKTLKKNKKENAAATAIQTIINNSTFNKVPETLKEAQKQQIDTMNRAQLSAQYGSIDFETILAQFGMTKDSYNKQLEESAENSVKVQLVTEIIAARENIVATDEAVKEYIAQNIESIGTTEEEYRNQYATYYGEAVPFDDFAKTSYLYSKVMELIKNNVKYKE